MFYRVKHLQYSILCNGSLNTLPFVTYFWFKLTKQLGKYLFKKVTYLFQQYFVECLEQFYRLLHYQSLIIIHTIYTYNKYALKPIILAQRGDKPLLASDSHRRCFDVRNKIIYCISTSLAHINIMKRSHAALIFKKESTKSKLKSSNTKIYL